MKVLLISPFFPPEVGSAAHLYYELGQGLQARGHEVTVLTGLPRYHVAGDLRKYRHRPFLWERYHGLPVVRVLNLNIPWNIPLLRGLDQFISSFFLGLAGVCLPPFDVALVYSPPLPLALAALGLCRLRRRPLVVNIQDLFPQSAIDLGILRDPRLIRLFRRLESWLSARADMLVCHSEGNRRHIIQAGGRPGRVMVIPNWIDTEAIRPGERHNALRASVGLTDEFLVSFAGIMGYSQDLETVLHCAAGLQEHRDIAFLLVGDGVEKPKLLAWAREKVLKNVHFLPMQPKDKYPEVLAASDLCLATLRPEVKTPVVPSKILSIMAAGRPVLAALPLEGDAPRLLQGAQCGLCVPPGNPEALARAILTLYRDPPLRARLAAQGRDYAVRHLSLAAAVARLEKYCEALW